MGAGHGQWNIIENKAKNMQIFDFKVNFHCSNYIKYVDYVCDDCRYKWDLQYTTIKKNSESLI